MYVLEPIVLVSSALCLKGPQSGFVFEQASTIRAVIQKNVSHTFHPPQLMALSQISSLLASDHDEEALKFCSVCHPRLASEQPSWQA
jgi:hypothetical protein